MSKNELLAAIKKNKPAPAELPEIPSFRVEAAPALNTFIETAHTVGSQVILKPNGQSVSQDIQALFPDAKIIVSTTSEVDPSLDLATILNPHELASIDVAVLHAQLGVAENGAVWVTEKECVFRVLPFITQHLVLLLDANTLIHNMHEAYEKIRIDATGFGLFIAGPSKTADIEQSLVIGAQGARSLTIIINQE